MIPIPRSIHINWEFIAKTWNNKEISNSELFSPIRKSMGPDHLAAFVDDLLWMAKALKNARDSDIK